MKNFEEIIAKIARENGTTPENVLREMQLAIDHAYDHHDKEAQKLWDMMSFKSDRPTPEECWIKTDHYIKLDALTML